MPRLRSNLAWYVGLRYGAWLTYQSERLKWTKYRFGKILGDVQASRVSAWMSGKRSVTPETAFEHGQRLAANGSSYASGPLALLASGYIADYLRFLQHLGAMVFEGGPAYAVTLYCTTPHALAWLDTLGKDEIFERYLDQMIESRSGITGLFLRHTGLALQEIPKPRQLNGDLLLQTSSETVRNVYEKAWQSALRGESFPDEPYGVEIVDTTYELFDEDDEIYTGAVSRWAQLSPLSENETRKIVKWALRRPRGMNFTPDGVLAWFERKPTVPKASQAWLHAIPNPGNWTIGDDDLALLELFAGREEAIGSIDHVIDFVIKQDTPYSSLVAPRAWRLLTEWAILTDAKTYRRLQSCIPKNYRPIT